jgi:general L-amino acid transport system permease protein
MWLFPLALKKVRGKIIIGIMAVVLYPFLANYLFLGGERGYLHYGLACLALAYLLQVYLDTALI